ncbi:hypothetical protein MMAG44476_34731 [Mycolicibacterium mageritense DSM 44476 = CIP 104973]|uniref:DUF732 domain-containing protein n=1 Tax=Mycolicibacterium mageritense TaxID=53462 RepID=A0ABN5Y9Q5_MYCME|nr:hypothetical protein [Mycolicibacterium mageritense]MCC9186223.1 hypothetical protein [Mycolicibacterium mageritense]BBX34844.1 hypothetical protein MMAGJ_41260 [Mycolicibacterium mageritense]CDO20637.1 hypothetical protein BN978_01094 [Mycolicibacterium mageritense DSM 44476 = CIP 104973]
MNLASGIALASAVIALLALAVAAWTFRQGAELNAFLVFTERYEKIMSELPHEARLHPEWNPEVDKDFAIRLRYLNLCSEEFYLKKRCLLSARVWGIWKTEMTSTLASRPYRDAWQQLRPHFSSYPEFSEFVDDCQTAR